MSVTNVAGFGDPNHRPDAFVKVRAKKVTAKHKMIALGSFNEDPLELYRSVNKIPDMDHMESALQSSVLNLKL